MTDLKTIGDYIIKSEKLDNCPYPTTLPCGLLLISAMCCAVILGLVQSFITQRHEYAFISVIGSIFIGFIFIIIGECLVKCGIKLTIQNKHNASEIDVKYYQFTINPYYDAQNIKNIIHDLEMEITSLIADEKTRLMSETEQKQICCDLYKERLTLIRDKDN